MLLDIRLDEAFRLVGRPELAKEEVVVPGQLPSAAHSPYRPDYDWLFLYERRLARFLEPWLKEFRHELIGAKGILSEALSNSYYHGHGKDPTLPIEVRIYIGVHGLIVRIKDAGNGFSVSQIHKQYQKGKAYYHVAGNGLRTMVSSINFGIFYDEEGSAFHLLHLFNRGFLNFGGNMVAENIVNNSVEGGSREVSEKVSISANMKSNACFVAPPAESNWMVLAILIGVKKRNLAAFGIGREKISLLIRSCGLLIKSVDTLNGHLQVGNGINMSVRAPEGILIISRGLSKEHILISVLKPDANLVLAAKRLPEIFRYLNEYLTCSD